MNPLPLASRSQNANASNSLIIGIGSPHGDDQLGWLLADQLAQRASGPFSVRTISNPIDLLHVLEDQGRVILCDACRGSGPPGLIRSWSWPDCDFAELRLSGTHGIGLAETLRLAKALGRLPPRIVLVTIEGECFDPGVAVSEKVLRTMPAAIDKILADISDLEPRFSR